MDTITKQNTTFNSTSSSHMDSCDDMVTINVKNYVKDLLKSRIFLGRYLERRLVDQRIGYRDIVLLSPAEIELKKDFWDAESKLRTLFTNVHWIGISDPEVIGYPPGICLWTEIDNQPFGAFWFQIKSVKFRDFEIIVLLKCIRHITDAFLEVEPILTGSVNNFKGKSNIQQAKVETILNDAHSDITINIRSLLSISNIKELLTFLFAFVIAIFTGSTAFINFLGNFILALVREMSILIKNSTPMFLGVLDFLSKIVGGFYILMAMFFKPNNPNPYNKRRITYYDRPQEVSNSRDFD